MRSQGEPESLDLLARGTGYSAPCGKTKPFGSSLSADVGKNSEPFGVSGKRKLSTYADSKGLKIPNRSEFSPTSAPRELQTVWSFHLRKRQERANVGAFAKGQNGQRCPFSTADQRQPKWPALAVLAYPTRTPGK